MTIFKTKAYFWPWDRTYAFILNSRLIFIVLRVTPLLKVLTTEFNLVVANLNI